MKHLIYALPLLFLVACGSSDKKSAAKMEETKTAEATKAATAEKKMAAAVGDVTCKIGKETRSLSVVKSESGCTLQYTKAGETKEVASGGVGSSHCQNTSDKIKGNLEAAGWKCE